MAAPRQQPSRRVPSGDRLALAPQDRSAPRIREAEVGLEKQEADYDKGGEKAKSRLSFELLNAAKDAGLEITPQLKAQIDRLVLVLYAAAAPVHADNLGERQRMLDHKG